MTRSLSFLGFASLLLSVLVIVGLLWITSAPPQLSPLANDSPYRIVPFDRNRHNPNPSTNVSGPMRSTSSKYAQTSSASVNQSVNNAVNAGKQIYAGIKQFQNRISNQNPTSLANNLVSPKTNSADSPRERAIRDMLARLGDEADLKSDPLSNTIRFLEGDLEKLVQDSQEYKNARQRGDFGGMALALADRIPEVMNVENPAEEFFPEHVSSDSLGMTHVILQQQYRGVPVWGAEVGVHFNAQQEPYQISGVYAPTPEGLPESAPFVGEQEAISTAMKSIGQQGPGPKAPGAQQMVYWDLGRKPVMCWSVELTPNYAEAWQVFVSTTDGSIVHRYNPMVTASVQASAADLAGQTTAFNCWQEGSTYYAIDATLPMYDAANSNPPNINQLKGAMLALDFRDQDPRQENADAYLIESSSINQWDPACVTLMSYYPPIDNYYRTTFDRNSIDGKGLNITFVINFQWPAGDQIGQTHNENACWNPSMNMMFFGDGDRLGGGKLPMAIDIVAHEYTHGVTGFEAGLIYETQSGALDEAFSDFFACMIDREDWLLAEDIIPLGQNQGKIAMRDMSQPGNPNVTDQNPAVMAEYRSLPIDTDNGGVHINCGIPSYMMYLIAEGGDYAIGKETTEKIVYRARNEYLTQRSQFIDFRRAMVSSARDLYGDASVEMQACEKAADAVGVNERDTPAPPPSTPGEVIDGSEMAIFLAANYDVGMDPIRNEPFYNIFLTANGDLVPLSDRFVASTRPAASGNGQWALFVDAFNNIYMTNGFQDQLILDLEVVRTIAMSKSERYIAFTSINYEPNIFVIDLNETDADRAIKQVPLRVSLNSEYESYIDLSYADVLTFNFRGDYLMFDAVQELKTASGETIDAWGLYSLRLSDLKCDIVMQPQPDVQFGDPLFAHTDDNLLLADLIVGQKPNYTFNTVLFDFTNQSISELLSDTGDVSRPTFRGDDERIVFRAYDAENQQYLLAEAALTDDKSSVVENSLQYVIPGINIELNHPIAFRTGEYVAQEGKISVPASLDFGNVDMGASAEQSLTISNQGNSDLQVLSVTAEGESADWIEHNGLEQRIAPGGSYTIQVQCQPLLVGAISARLRVRSTDFDRPNLTIDIIGQSAPSAQATPTATVILPDPTPTPTATPTPPAQTGVEPIAAYEFDEASLTADGWTEIPGGFMNATAGHVTANRFVGQQIPSSQDRVGLQISVEPNQVAFIHASQPVDTGGAPVLIRASVRADAAGAAVALAALKGNLSTGEAVDSGIATHIPATAANLMASETQMVLLYEPDASSLVTPVIQVAANAEETVNAFVDRVEVIALNQTTAYTGGSFGSAIGVGGTANESTVEPAALYSFDQISLTGNGWSVISGGFTGATAGEISANSFVGSLIPSSQDKVGLLFAVDKGETAFMHAAAPIETNGRPLLIRATFRADAAGAAVALAGLQGILSTGEGVDGSIVTHIPGTAALMVDAERTLTLVCPSNTIGKVTPIVQVTGSDEQTVHVFIDQLEVYRLDPNAGYTGALLSSTP